MQDGDLITRTILLSYFDDMTMSAISIITERPDLRLIQMSNTIR